MTSNLCKQRDIQSQLFVKVQDEDTVCASVAGLAVLGEELFILVAHQSPHKCVHDIGWNPSCLCDLLQ